MKNLPSVFTEPRYRSFGERLWSAIRRLSWREFTRKYEAPLFAGMGYLSREFEDELSTRSPITASRKQP